LGDKAGKISGQTEKRRLAERDDAGVTENEIERQRKQREDRRIFHDQILAREQPDGRKNEDPKSNLQR
jgi:hypothetical protein